MMASRHLQGMSVHGLPGCRRGKMPSNPGQKRKWQPGGGPTSLVFQIGVKQPTARLKCCRPIDARRHSRIAYRNIGEPFKQYRRAARLRSAADEPQFLLIVVRVRGQVGYLVFPSLIGMTNFVCSGGCLLRSMALTMNLAMPRLPGISSPSSTAVAGTDVGGLWSCRKI